jgi:hypothetical protein
MHLSLRLFTLLFVCLTGQAYRADAQLKAYGGKQSDNSCKVIFLVNPTDSIYYIAGIGQNALPDCQTFNSRLQEHTGKFRINVSNHEDDFLLLLPKDTIAYNILIPADQAPRDKELSVLLRNSAEVIGINNDKKRNRQIKRLEPRRVNLPIIER